MIENKELGVKIAETTNESFWEDTKQKCKEAIEAEERNLKINRTMIKLCEEQLALK
jgi:hypothetical protein